MTTATAEAQVIIQGEARSRTLADYDVCKVPVGWHTVSLKQTQKEWNLGNPRRHDFSRSPSNQLAVPVPAPVWEKIMEAIPVFGLREISVSAPQEAFYAKHVDPLILGKANGKWYFIAAWNLPEAM